MSTKKKRVRRPRYTATTADRHELYQIAVQSPAEDIRFLARVYRESNPGREARHLREDFCGTALLAAAWVGSDARRTAEGFDIDPEPLAWGRRRNVAPLGAAARRLVLHQADARSKSARAPDIRCAHNFSYWVFKTRPVMLDYFRRAYRELAPRGVFVIDLHGGPEAFQELEEATPCTGGFTYVWDQAHYWPIPGAGHFYIHFRFRDGSEMKRAFSYDWRVWGLTELRDLLHDAGFRQVECYWEGTAPDGRSGNGVFRRAKRGDNCESYIAYLVGKKE